MTLEMAFVMIMIIIMLGGLLLEIARPDIIIFSVLIVFLITGIVTPVEALKGFSNQGMLTIALLFIVAGAVQKSGLVDRVMKARLRKSKSHTSAMFHFFIPTAALSALLNNTPIVVTFTPIIKNWCKERGIAPSKFLIPLSYATILGGTITLLGTSTNLVVHGMLLDYGFKGLSFFQLAFIGIPITIVGLIYLFTIGYRLLPEHKGFHQQVEEFSREYLSELVVEDSYPHINKTVFQAGLRDLAGLYLIEIIRENERLSPVRPTTVIQAGDHLIFTGLISTIADVQSTEGLKLEPGTNLELDDLKNGNSQLVEAVVSHQSSLVGKSIKRSKFRSKYDAGVIAVHRNNERIKSKIGDIILRPGDTLLLLTGTEFIEKYRPSKDFYVVSSLQTPQLFQNNHNKGWLAIGILFTMVALATIGVLSMFNAMAVAVLILLVTKVISAEEAERFVQFHVLLLIASSFGIGVAMTKTGLAQWIADGILAVGQPLGLFSILLLIYVLTNLFTELITNSAAAVLMIPIGIEIAEKLHLDPIGFAMIIAIAASASFITPIGYQTNLIVYGPGGYKFKDYIKIGTPLSIIVMLMTVTITYFWWF